MLKGIGQGLRLEQARRVWKQCIVTSNLPGLPTHGDWGLQLYVLLPMSCCFLKQGYCTHSCFFCYKEVINRFSTYGGSKQGLSAHCQEVRESLKAIASVRMS